MAFLFMSQIKCINNFVGDRKPTIVAEYVCDTQNDLPARSQSDYYVGIGSTAVIVDDSSKWRIKSDGTWVMYEQGTATYTKSEIDALLSLKANKATTLAGYGITNAYTKTQTDTAIANETADKITMLSILGAGTRIEATSEFPLNFDDAPFTSVGRFNWLSTSTPYITNCPTYIGGAAKGGLLETSYIQGSSTVLQTAWSSAGADSPSIFWQRFRYGAGTTANPYRWTSWYKFEGVQV